MMSAYNESYLDDAMQNLGDMVEYAVCDCGYDPDEFFGWFISSGVASKRAIIGITAGGVEEGMEYELGDGSTGKADITGNLFTYKKSM